MLGRLESSIERTCRLRAEDRACLLLKLTGVVGIPDRMLLAPHGRAAFIEFKRPRLALGAIQEYRVKVLTELGHVVLRVDSVARFDNLLDDILTRRSWPV
jgi:hypothetical protein